MADPEWCMSAMMPQRMSACLGGDGDALLPLETLRGDIKRVYASPMRFADQFR